MLHQRQVWWLTACLVLTLWELSAPTRVATLAMERIYGYRRRRGLVELMPRSLALGAVVRFGPLVTGDLDACVRECA